jgi:hypothetical protein
VKNFIFRNCDIGEFNVKLKKGNTVEVVQQCINQGVPLGTYAVFYKEKFIGRTTVKVYN